MLYWTVWIDPDGQSDSEDAPVLFDLFDDMSVQPAMNDLSAVGEISGQRIARPLYPRRCAPISRQMVKISHARAEMIGGNAIYPAELGRCWLKVWIDLLIASVFEITWAIALKYSEGLRRFWPNVILVIAFLLSFIFLARAVRTLPIGTAYAVWTGIGAVGTALLGMLLFAESTAPLRLLCIVLIIVGIVGLRLLSAAG
jgi:quaternary ammonium compound-resistance protein SugE